MDREIIRLVIVLHVPEQVHRGIKGVVKDVDGNGIKGATISVRGIRKDVTTGKYNPTWIKYSPFALTFKIFLSA